LKEDQLRLGVRILKGDCTLGSEILRRSRVGSWTSICGRDKVLVATHIMTYPPLPFSLVVTPYLSHSGCDMGCIAFRPYHVVG
ncbi:hypothetical protein Taro_007022, partial [Colocasia esculenta]|nr:hypothetical protein [Colocasia esculenta]